MDIWKVTHIWTEELYYKKLSDACFKVGVNVGTLRNKFSRAGTTGELMGKWKFEKIVVY